MKRLPNINLTEEEYLNLINQKITRGGEGIICRGTKPNTLIKLFIDLSDKRHPMSENKEKKITRLFQMNLDELVKPLQTISYNGTIIGYEMTYDQLDTSLRRSILTRKEKIKILKESKDILIALSKKDITYGDVTEENILYNPKTKQVKFCDIDNIRIGTLPIDIRGFSLNKYFTATGSIDHTSDAYMHNILTLRQLAYNPSTYDTEILLDLKREIYPSKFKRSVQETLKSMTKPQNFTGEYIIQHVKR